jgi:uncharacterized protein YbjT (DUF2867 family)
MQRPVLILGGYGNFGKRIANALAKAGVPIIIAGRDKAKAEALVRTLPENSVTPILVEYNGPRAFVRQRQPQREPDTVQAEVHHTSASQ